MRTRLARRAYPGANFFCNRASRLRASRYRRTGLASAKPWCFDAISLTRIPRASWPLCDPCGCAHNLRSRCSIRQVSILTSHVFLLLCKRSAVIQTVNCTATLTCLRCSSAERTPSAGCHCTPPALPALSRVPCLAAATELTLTRPDQSQQRNTKEPVYHMLMAYRRCGHA